MKAMCTSFTKEDYYSTMIGFLGWTQNGKNGLKCIDEGDVGAVIYPNSDEPLQKWWMHIESLDDKDVPDNKKDV